ncbi:MAG: response regulator [Paracoccaceae bacterium]
MKDETDQTRILIADDHMLISEAVARLLQRSGDFEVLTAMSLPDTLRVLEDQGPVDIVMLDLKMPGMNGIESIRQVVKANEPGRVVLFSGSADANFVQSAIKAGALGLIPKTLPLRSLLSAIGLVDSGQIFVPAQLSQGENASPAREQAQLSEKELFVLRRAAEGYTNKEIARDLVSNEMSVKMHMRMICKKLGAKNRTHAAMIARELALL